MEEAPSLIFCTAASLTQLTDASFTQLLLYCTDVELERESEHLRSCPLTQCSPAMGSGCAAVDCVRRSSCVGDGDPRFAHRL
jgi:hypothetical protein